MFLLLNLSLYKIVSPLVLILHVLLPPFSSYQPTSRVHQFCLYILTFSFRKHREVVLSRNILIFLCSSILILYIVFIVFNSLDESEMGPCGFIVGLLHFLLLLVMCWMAIEGLHIYTMVLAKEPKEVPNHWIQKLVSTNFMTKAILFAFGEFVRPHVH